ncbi:V-type ATP synthase subunit I [Christensenellaceae bacterium OttesenSCG-928-L17]|nr:V-type ATP synthase subunit I [Christensenellaceae bacterium OttesenSCG-928-L17]
MKRLTLVALKGDEERLMQALQAISAVQIIHTGESIADDDALQRAEANVQRLNHALGALKPYAKKPSMLEPKPEVTVGVLRENMGDALLVCEAIETAERRRTAVRTQIDKHNTQIEALLPWQTLTTKLNLIAPTKSAAIFAGSLKAEQLVRLDEIKDQVAVQVFDGEKEIAVLVACHQADAETVGAFLKALDWTDVSFPKVNETASELIEKDREAIAVLTVEAEQIEQEFHTLGENRALIASSADAAVIERDRALARNLMEKTQSAFALEGWVRSDEVAQITQTIKSVTDTYYLDLRDPEEGEEQPAVMKNGKFATPYESVTKLYSLPQPGSIDGTPFMAPWYFLLFGMMLSDTGYGIVLALGCLFFIKKAQPRGMMGDLARVIMMGGISTIFWGFLTGTFFGMDWNPFLISVGNLFNKDWSAVLLPNGPDMPGLFPLIVDPGKDPISMLILCFGLGLVHVFFGVFIKIYMSFRDGDWQTALFDNISWVLIVFGLLLFAGGPMLFPEAKVLSTIGMVAALAGAAMVLFMKGRGKRNIAKRLVSGAGGLYDITSYLSDILSYARLFALGIATGVIGSVFNQLVSMIMGASSFWLIKIVLVIIGIALLTFLHLFNIGINTLGTFVHCARLQYVEFYGKFYEVGGREFRPLGYKTRHVRVTEE